jgi:hypothetical protein
MVNYTQWYMHGEADRVREEVFQPRLEDYDDDAGVEDMLNDYHKARSMKNIWRRSQRQVCRRSTIC